MFLLPIYFLSLALSLCRTRTFTRVQVKNRPHYKEIFLFNDYKILFVLFRLLSQYHAAEALLSHVMLYVGSTLMFVIGDLFRYKPVGSSLILEVISIKCYICSEKSNDKLITSLSRIHKIPKIRI